MNNRILSTPLLNRLQQIIKPDSSWSIILGFIFICIIWIFFGPSRYLNYVFPVFAFGVGLFLYLRSPILYLGFTWWLWFLTPLVRRLVDYRSSYTDPSPIMLAPVLVTLITLITFYRCLPKTFQQDTLAFIFSIASVFYGLSLGLFLNPPLTTIIRFLDSLVPVIFGFHLFVNWQYYPELRKNISTVYFWGIFLMGIYGLFQFVVAPEWDAYWLNNSTFSSGGIPVPFGLEIWSTAASNRPFAVFMMTGLLLLLIKRNYGVFNIVVTVVGYLTFLLSQRRSIWFGWFIGLILLIIYLPRRDKIRLVLFIALAIIIVSPLLLWQPFTDTITSRLETFLNLEDDISANTRIEFTELYLDTALTSVVGQGFGSLSIDNGMITLLLHLGWIGTIPYLGGFLKLLVNAFQGYKYKTDSFAILTRSIALVIILQLPLASPQLDSEGMVMWSFVSLSLASRKYHQYFNIQ